MFSKLVCCYQSRTGLQFRNCFVGIEFKRKKKLKVKVQIFAGSLELDYWCLSFFTCLGFY